MAINVVIANIGLDISNLVSKYYANSSDFNLKECDFQEKLLEHYFILSEKKEEYGLEFILGIKELINQAEENPYAVPALTLLLDRPTLGRRVRNVRSLEHLLESGYFTAYIDMVSNPIHAELDGEKVVLFTTGSDKWASVPEERERKQSKVIKAWEGALKYPFSAAEMALLRKIGPDILDIGKKINGTDWYPRALIDIGVSSTPQKSLLLINYINASIAKKHKIKAAKLAGSGLEFLDTAIGIDILTPAARSGCEYLELHSDIMHAFPLGLSFKMAAQKATTLLKSSSISPDEVILAYLGQTAHNGFKPITNLEPLMNYPGSVLVLGTHISPNEKLGRRIKETYELNYMNSGIAKLAEYTLRVLGFSSKDIPKDYFSVLSLFGWNCRVLDTKEGYLLSSLWEKAIDYSDGADLMLTKKHLRKGVKVPIPAGWLSYKPTQARLKKNLNEVGWDPVMKASNSYRPYDGIQLNSGMVSVLVCRRI